MAGTEKTVHETVLVPTVVECTADTTGNTRTIPITDGLPSDLKKKGLLSPNRPGIEDAITRLQRETGIRDL